MVGSRGFFGRLADRLARFCRWTWRHRWRLAAVAFLALLIDLGYLYYDFQRDDPQAFSDNPERQFKYGSTGGDRVAGIPVGIWKALPTLCRRYLPGDGWQSLGFIFEKGMDRPIGTSQRHSLGFDRIFLNCAVCHVGTYRANTASPRQIVLGMPANRLRLDLFTRFLTQCALDERFNPWQVVQAAEDAGARYSFLQRMLLEYVAVPAVRELLILARYRFRFLDNEIEAGPGRFDTFNPAKALLNWPFERLPPRETVGIVDFPSLWLQKQREGMWLHWDGNNNSVEERNRSAAFGTGAIPTTLDTASLAVIARWLRTGAVPPSYPFAIDRALAARGKPLYERYCAACHGHDGRDFSGTRVGTVDPIDHVRTDPCRLDNYTHALAAEQGNLYSGFPDLRFSHFRKTDGYANMPLDGIWLRAPYLHNGSVPTLRDLLEPSSRRPAFFYRGYDVIDRKKVGFVSNVPVENGASFFRYETRCTDDPKNGVNCAFERNPDNRHDDNICHPGKWAGNSNSGHEGAEYGTELPAGDKDAIVEYLKTF
jgi:hypothetical protein